MDCPEQSVVTDQDKKHFLFQQQKETLDIFLCNGAITRAQYDKSLGDLIVKMGIEEAGEETCGLRLKTGYSANRK